MTRRWGNAQWHAPKVDVREPERITVRLGFTDGSCWEYPLNACGRTVCSVAVNGVDFAPSSRHAELGGAGTGADARVGRFEATDGAQTGEPDQRTENNQNAPLFHSQRH